MTYLKCPLSKVLFLLYKPKIIYNESELKKQKVNPRIDSGYLKQDSKMSNQLNTIYLDAVD